MHRCCLNGHLEVLKYLHEEAKAPWDWRTAAWAAANGHLHILEYLVERKYDQYDAYACDYAAEDGHLDCLKYLHETAKAPWDYGAVQVAHENNHPNVYNTSSTTTVHYQTVGDTKEEHYTTRNNRRGVQDRSARARKKKSPSIGIRGAERQIHRYGARNSSELKSRETHIQKAKRKPVITPTSHVITNRNTIGAQRGLKLRCADGKRWISRGMNDR